MANMAIVSLRLYLTTQENKYKHERKVSKILCISFDQIIRTLLKTKKRENTTLEEQH